MLGHYSTSFTLDTYAYVTTDDQLKAAQTIGNILSRTVFCCLGYGIVRCERG